MIALQLDKTQKTPFLVEALDGAHIKYTKMLSEEITLWHKTTLGWKINYPRNRPLLPKRCCSSKWAGSQSVLEYYGEFMEAVNYSYSDGNRDEQLLAGLFIGHMTPSLRDALKKRKM